MKKILPIVEPIINFSPTNDALLSVLQTDPSLYPFIMENYIDIYHWNIKTLKEWPFVEFSSGKFWNSFDCLISTHIRRDIALLSDITEYVKTAINNGYYIFMEIDMYYNQNYSCFNKNSNRHEIFIYGYNDDSEKFYTADYFDGIHFSHKLSDYSQLAESFIKNPDHNALDGFIIFKLRNDVIRTFNLNKVYLSLKQLINPIYFSNDFKARFYGFMFFEEFKELMLSITNEDNFGIGRLMHFLLCHIKLMYLRLKYLYELYNERKFLILHETTLKLYNKFLILRNKSLKYDIRRKKSYPEELLNSIIAGYNIILDEYRKIIQSTITIIETLDIEFEPLAYRLHC